jgi:hypothetical protein
MPVDGRGEEKPFQGEGETRKQQIDKLIYCQHASEQQRARAKVSRSKGKHSLFLYPLVNDIVQRKRAARRTKSLHSIAGWRKKRAPETH